VTTYARSDEGRRPAGVVKAVFEARYNYMKSGQLRRQVLNKINTVDFNDMSEREHFGEFYEQLSTTCIGRNAASLTLRAPRITPFMADRIDPKPARNPIDPACGTGGAFSNALIRHHAQRIGKSSKEARGRS